MNPERDTLFSAPIEEAGGFVFDERVARVFPDMIRRSVPGYLEVVAMSGLIAERYVQEDTRIYDLGCSLGATTFSILDRLQSRSVRVVAVDNSPAMVRGCARMLQEQGMRDRVDLVCADVRRISIEDTSMVVLNFTLQFIPPEERYSLLCRVWEGLLPRGVLVLSEKTTAAEADVEEEFTQLHHAFKRAQGYSDLEISQKRAALENVLIPESLEKQQTRLKKAGFSKSAVWYRCFDFVSLLAWK
ncbi:MAG TPA: carboxy-S-adenosyl-L-methionine synthase CmoA [Chromatiales bacterium]|nr:carboxy-S-adenosyl-L-methionine synthase CmoA [Chromatiales bacterium]